MDRLEKINEIKKAYAGMYLVGTETQSLSEQDLCKDIEAAAYAVLSHDGRRVEIKQGDDGRWQAWISDTSRRGSLTLFSEKSSKDKLLWDVAIDGPGNTWLTPCIDAINFFIEDLDDGYEGMKSEYYKVFPELAELENL